MKVQCLLVRAGAWGAILMCFLAQVAAAEMPRAGFCSGDPAARSAMQAAWSGPMESDSAIEWSYAAFRGLGCQRCNTATQYCVVNPLRNEYACAPYGTVACIGADRTGWCRAGRACWAGRCQ